MCHILPSYGKACPHELKSHHIIHVPYHVVNHHNIATYNKFQKNSILSIYIDTGKYRVKNLDTYHKFNSFMPISYLGVLLGVNQCELTIHIPLS